MNYIICLKWGKKYSAEYVNKLYAMTQRHCKVPHQFICFTESRKDIDKEIKTINLPTINLDGWWFKPWFFSKDLPIQGTMLYFDLDVIVFRNIDKLFEYKPKQFCIIRDFNRSIRPGFDRINSSVFRLETGMFDPIWKQFENDPKLHMQKNRGDQDWMYKNIRNFSYWPDEWIQSYKWEMRGKPEMTRINGVRNFAIPGAPKILPQTSVAVFHGEPHPHQCEDNWVIENWR